MEDIIILQEETGNEKNFDAYAKKHAQIPNSFENFLKSFKKVKTKDKVVFYRLIATMLNAGMSIIKSVAVLEKQEKNKYFKTILADMMKGLKEGRNFSECLEVYSNSFTNAEIGIIRAGEKTWKLNEVMIALADQVEKVVSISGKLKSALMYPVMILFVVFGVIVVMMTMVVPKLLAIFDDASTLPPTTRALVLISEIFQSYWYLMIIFWIIVYFGLSYYKKTDIWRYNWDAFILKIPIFGMITQKVTLSKFSRVFAGLMASWVSVVESLKIVSEAVGNEVYRQRILLLLEDVRKWMKMWESLELDPLFPDIMVQMIQVGEQSAKLDVTIVKVADFYDEQVDVISGTISKLLEPFIIVFLAVVVGFIAIAIMQPIMGLADTISQG